MATKVKATPKGKGKMTTGTKVAIGAGVVLLLGGIAYFMYRKSKAKKDCISKGGTWNNETKKCEMPIVVPPTETKALKDAYDNLLFETGKDVIKSSSYPSLNEVVDIFKTEPNWSLKLVGHTDSSGDKNYNLTLSQNRALSVKNYLISKGIEGSRITSEGVGIAQPIADNSTSAGRAKNRRVEFIVTKA